MKFSIHLFTTLFILFLSARFAQAQSPPSFTLGVSQLAQPTMNLLDTIWAKTYHFTLTDTNNISKIHIKMGTTLSGSEVFSYVFDYDQTTNLPIGFHYARNGMEITLKVSGYSYGYYYYEAKLEDGSQNFSASEQTNSSMHLN
jgi:hypothetical protein